MRPPNLKSSTPEHIESTIGKMSPEQIHTIIQLYIEGEDTNWKEKTQAAIIGLNDRAQLEAAGKALSGAQTLMLIDTTLQPDNCNHWKLSPLLVGMPHETFISLLANASDEQLLVLRHEGMTNSVQHQLTTFCHDMSQKISEVEEEIDNFTEEIENLKTQELGREDVLEMIHRIDLFGEFFTRLLDNANKALAIAWNTKRLDLIESLNKVKDSCQKYLVYGIGTPRGESTAPTCLYATLEERLFRVYGDPDNPADFEAVHDDEPAMEGLVRLSVWYLRDYWEAGLLPSVRDCEEIETRNRTNSEKERSRYRDNLFAEAKVQIQKAGLNSVADLKRACIFSKRTLQEYLKRH